MNFEELSKNELKNIIITLVKENQNLKERIRKEKLKRVTFKDVAIKYLSLRENTTGISTYISYKNIVENHLIKYFGNILLVDIDALKIEEYYNKKILTLSANTVRKHQVMMNLIFKFAIKLKLIKDNPIETTSIIKTIRPTTNFYRENDLKNMLFKMKGTPIYSLVLLCTLGLRRSEALAVKWEDIDFTTGELNVKAKIDALNKYSLILKNKTSYRIIIIPKWFLKEFEELKQNCDNLVWVCFNKRKSTHITTSSASHSFKYYVDKFNLKPITLKGLRHSCATLICSKGYNLNYVKDWLGHSTIKITADIYSHTDVSDKNKIAEKLNTIFDDSFL